MDSEAAGSRDNIRADLQTLGVKPGGALLVHSSFKSLGEVPGGIQTLIDALKDSLGPDGTLFMPGLSYVFVTREQLQFDVRNTPSCVGAVPEYFRRMDGTLRSVHPTHSMCGQGPMARELLDRHILDTTPCGPCSPFSRLRQIGGQILMLGCGLLHNTTLHAVEEAAGAPYILETEPLEYTLVGYDGIPVKATHRRHTVFPQHYDRVGPALLGHGIVGGRVLRADCYLLDAAVLWDCALDMMKKDLFCFYKD